MARLENAVTLLLLMMMQEKGIKEGSRESSDVSIGYN